jgi:acetyltransferase-like isoleucine patch superfamily enzyme
MTIKEAIIKIHKKILESKSQESKIDYLRRQGMKIGQNCNLETMDFSTEPYLIEIGNHVAIAYGTSFITHDGGVWCFRQEDLINGDIFGKIKIGNNVLIGINSIILPNTTIGDNCIIGAGSVVRGKFPNNSVIFGNPAKVQLNMSIQKMFYQQNPGFLKTNNLTGSQKEKIIKKHFGLE